jgi:hypothetical protein
MAGNTGRAKTPPWGNVLAYVCFRTEHLQRVMDKFWLVAVTFQLWNRKLARKVLVAFWGT